MLRLQNDDAAVRRIVGAAVSAPSIHNTQPWQFRIAADDVIELRADISRALWVADPLGRALHLSCGAALLNLRLAVRMSGCNPLVWPLPEPEADPMLLASVQLTDGRPASIAERSLFEAISQRHTSRSPFADRIIGQPLRVLLDQEASQEHSTLRWLTRRETGTVLGLVALADRELRSDLGHRSELADWIRSPAGGEHADADGVPYHALGPEPARLPGPVRDLGYATPGGQRASASFERRPQLAVVSTSRNEPADWLRAGQALQRVLLSATGHKLSASLLYQPIELQDMHMRRRWWPWPEHPQIIVRFGFGSPADGTPRRSLGDVLETEV